MRTLIVSDIHSNLAALRAVLEDARARGGFDAVWCLGDTVGYGPDPEACLTLLGQYQLLMVAGNHDYGAIGKISVDDFNQAAYQAVVWTGQQLSPESARYLGCLPETTMMDPFTLAHGSLRAPLLEYLITAEAALATFQRMTTPYCLVGHSHYPFVCIENQGSPQFVEFPKEQPVLLGEERLIINPGSVGQPRDGDPRASYLVYADPPGSVEHRRVAYNIPETQEKMRRAGLPPELGQRLDLGR